MQFSATTLSTRPRIDKSRQFHISRCASEQAASSASRVPLEATQVSAEVLEVAKQDGQEQQAATTKRFLAVGAASLAGVAALVPQFSAKSDFDKMAAQAMPYEAAMRNGKPTLLQFYADWCKQCKAMAPIVTELSQQYRTDLNLVIMNVDNPKWMAEASRYNVQSIPEYVFLTSSGDAEAIFVGPVPKKIMSEQVGALALARPLPYGAVQNAATRLDTQQEEMQPRGTAGPLDHGVKKA